MKRHTPEFAQLQAEWYQRLADDGFVDEESPVKNAKDGEDDFILRKHSTNAYRGSENAQRDAKLAYFQQVMSGVLTHRFAREVDKLVMRLHAEGATLRGISLLLQTLELKPNNRETLRYIIRRYEHLWGIRHWDETEQDRYLKRKQTK